MVWVPGGDFLMGSEDFYPEERPVHTAHVDGFWMDAHPVTVAEFRRFVKATGHVTVAETAPDAADFPDAAADQLVPGSLVFTPPGQRVSLDDFRAWWAWVPGAQWRHPEGPGQHPARPRAAPGHPRRVRRRAGLRRVGRQGASDRARVGVRGARWAGGRGLRMGGRRRPPADARWPTPGRETSRCTTSVLDGYERTSPVGVVPAQRVRAGRHDRQRVGVDVPGLHEQPRRQQPGRTTERADGCCAPRRVPDGDAAAHTGSEDDSSLKVIKGGSHLCAPNYCLRYRPAARQSQTLDTSTSHLGFRCISRGGRGPAT